MDQIQGLTGWIGDQADDSAKEILASAQAQREEALAQSRRESEERFSSESAAAQRRSEVRLAGLERQLDDSLAQERMRLMLSETEQAFSLAEDRLCRLSAEEFRAFFTQSLSALPLKGEYTLRLGELTAKTLNEAERSALALKTRDYSLELSPDLIPGQGGFLLERFPVEYSFLYRDLLSDLKANKTAAVIKLLFLRV